MAKTVITARRPRRMARTAEPQSELSQTIGGPDLPAAAPIPQKTTSVSKSARVVGMLQREHGASLDELVAAMGWLPHTTRAALTGLRKKGYLIASEKVEDVRRYRIAGEAA